MIMARIAPLLREDLFEFSVNLREMLSGADNFWLFMACSSFQFDKDRSAIVVSGLDPESKGLGRFR
jgi:hypothetical protein